MTTDRDDMTDPALAQLLREAADESPPAHVDATILAAARRAVEPGQRVRSAASPWRWLLPLGAAATIAAIVISLQPLAPTPVEPMSSADNAPARQADQASPAGDPAPASASALAPPPAKPQQRVIANSRSSGASVAPEHDLSTQKREARKAAAAEPPATATAPAAAPAATLAGAPAAPSAAAAPTREQAAARVDAGHDATAWIQRIRTLLRESRRDEAAEELARFRAAFADADARLPDDLRAFAAQSHAKSAPSPR